MRLIHLLPLAGFAAAIVLPDEQVMAEVAIEDHHAGRPVVETVAGDFLDEVKHITDDIKDKASSVLDTSKNYLDDAIAYATDAENKVSERIHSVGFDIASWLANADEDESDGPHDGPHHPPHRKPPHGKPPKDGHPPHRRPPHRGHSPHKKSNQTIYQLISKSKYTTKLAKLIDEDADLVKTLNGTKANYTIFAPTDAAFEKIPEHAPKPSPEFLKALLLYHVSPHFYPAGRLAFTHTLPTLLDSAALGDRPQRLASRLGLRGLTLNFYSKVVAANIFASNGVIHGVDSIILPPPSVLKIVELLPGEFSTLELGLTKTGLLKSLNTTATEGLTFFAPSNIAFKKLGPKINAFLFSRFGEKYLKALLEYHVVANRTLYTDAFYDVKADSVLDDGILEMHMMQHGCQGPRHHVTKSVAGFFSSLFGRKKHNGPSKLDNHTEEHKRPHGPPRHIHFDLPTLLEDKPVSINIDRFGPITSIRVNGQSHVTVSDGVAKDGVIQVVSNVLIPPKKPQGQKKSKKHQEPWFEDEEEMSVEEFKARFEPLIENEGGEDSERLEM